MRSLLAIFSQIGGQISQFIQNRSVIILGHVLSQTIGTFSVAKLF